MSPKRVYSYFSGLLLRTGQVAGFCPEILKASKMCWNIISEGKKRYGEVTEEEEYKSGLHGGVLAQSWYVLSPIYVVAFLAHVTVPLCACHLLSFQQVPLLTLGLAYCVLCYVLVVPGIQKIKIPAYTSTHPNVQPVWRAS